MAYLYLVSGVGGNIFSALCNNNPSVGASTADFGILMGLMAMIIVNWHSFDGSHQLETTRCMLMFMIVFMIFFNLLVGIRKPGVVDTAGHIGGALCGMLYGFAYFPRSVNPWAIKLVKVG